MGFFGTVTPDGQLVHGPMVIDIIKEHEIIDEDGVRSVKILHPTVVLTRDLNSFY